MRRHYMPVIVSYSKSGAPVRLPDVAGVQDSVEDLRAGGSSTASPPSWSSSSASLTRISSRRSTVWRTSFPSFRRPCRGGSISPSSRTGRRRSGAPFRDVEISLLISFGLVILVVFAFLRNVRATIIPAVAVAVSLIGTFGVMYIFGYNLDNLSLMALTVATGFVVDDAIVVLENVTRHMEQGVPAGPAALLGSRRSASRSSP